MKRCALLSLLCMLLAGFCLGQNAARTIEIIVERANGERWEAVDGRTVFKPEERIRFRLRSSFSGFLYVLDETDRGAFVWLFPEKNAGLQNQIEAGSWSLIPATQGAFGIPRQAGFEKIYWILSPTPLRDLNTDVPRIRDNQKTMVPRCDEPILKARGTCLDRTAGPREVGNSSPLQGIAGTGSTLRSRNLAFDQTAESSTIRARNLADDMIVYEFRIAHR